MKIVKNIVKALFAEDISQTTNSESTSLDGAVGYCVQADMTLDTPSAKTFDSPAAAALTFQDVTLTAQEEGTDGNAISIELLVTATPSEPLAIDVTGTAISVTLENDAGMASELEEQDLTYTAVEVGEDGDDITITYVADGTAGAETVDVTGTDIVVHMDDTPVTGSTANDILAAVEASVPASALVSVAVTGTGTNVQAAAAETPLAGGQDPAVVTDADALVIAINGDAPANALVEATGTGNTPLIALAEDNLEGGRNSEVDVDDNTVTIPSHGFTTGLKGQLTTTGVLPSGLSTATDYYIIVIDANTVQFASSLENANAGTEIDLADDGSGVATFTSTTLAGASIKLQHRLNDSMDWIDVSSSSNNITATSSFIWNVDAPHYGEVRAVLTMTAGQLAADVQIAVKVLT